MHRHAKITVVLSALMLGAVAAAVQNGVDFPLSEDGAPPAREPGATRFAVVVSRPSGPPRVETGAIDDRGAPVTASCTTCHATRESDAAGADASALDEFHQGLVFAHGEIACLSCHNSDDYDALRLASGASVPYTDVMTLCGQCHGPQLRGYERGAHGGMAGHWDLTRGPRYRNGCTDCHDPHAPAFPGMMPTFKPRDRFLEPRSGAAHTPTRWGAIPEAAHE